MQAELKIMGLVESEIIDLPEQWVKACKTPQAAMRLCIINHPSKASQDHISDVLGVKAGNLSRILNSDASGDNRYLCPRKIALLQRECKNRAVSQWLDLYGRGLIEGDQ